MIVDRSTGEKVIGRIPADLVRYQGQQLTPGKTAGLHRRHAGRRLGREPNEALSPVLHPRPAAKMATRTPRARRLSKDVGI